MLLTNALLRPNGLDLLVNKVSIDPFRKAAIKVSDEIPGTMLHRSIPLDIHCPKGDFMVKIT